MTCTYEYEKMSCLVREVFLAMAEAEYLEDESNSLKQLIVEVNKARVHFVTCRDAEKGEAQEKLLAAKEALKCFVDKMSD